VILSALLRAPLLSEILKKEDMGLEMENRAVIEGEPEWRNCYEMLFASIHFLRELPLGKFVALPSRPKLTPTQWVEQIFMQLIDEAFEKFNPLMKTIIRARQRGKAVPKLAEILNDVDHHFPCVHREPGRRDPRLVPTINIDAVHELLAIIQSGGIANLSDIITKHSAVNINLDFMVSII